jgi:hypothetical protein
LAIATAALPFVIKRLGSDKNHRKAIWNYYFGVEKDIRRIVQEVLYPYSFPKRIIASSVGMLLLQPAFFTMTRKEKLMLNKRYRHARELMILQNNISPCEKDLEKFWPSHGTRGGAYRKKTASRGNRRGRRK